MHEFRWMAPIHVGFTSLPGVIDRDPDGYRRFWDDVEERTGSSRWVIHRGGRADAPLGWSKASADTLPRPLEVVSGRIDPAALPSREDLRTVELSWSLYDHGVLLVEGVLRTADGVSGAHLENVDHWEAAVQDYGETLSRFCAEHEYQKLSELLASLPQSAAFVRLEDVEVTRPLWVTRAYVLHRRTKATKRFARSWVSGIDRTHDLTIERVIAGAEPLLAQWMNHVHRADRADEVTRSWHALQKAQFFWAAMQWIDEALRHILAWSMGDRIDVSVSQLRRELRATIDEAQDLLMLRAEVRQHVSRSSHAEMQRFLGFWEFSELLEKPVLEKVDNCKERLASLAEDRAARSAVFTDIILMGIGVTSVLATAIALVQFGRDASKDPSQSVYDFGGGSITSWLSSQSMDAILVLSLMLSIMLIVVFIWKRRQSISR